MNVQEIFAEEMKQYRFKKKRLNWHLPPNDDIVCAITLQASWHTRKAFGDHTVVVYCRVRDLGFWPPDARTDGPFEASYKNESISVSLFDLYNSNDAWPFLNDEVEMDVVVRREEIANLLSNKIVPIAQKLRSIDGIIDLANSNELPDRVFGGFVHSYLLIVTNRYEEFQKDVAAVRQRIQIHEVSDPEFAEVHRSQLIAILELAKSHRGWNAV
jgi:hypothetical protein